METTIAWLLGLLGVYLLMGLLFAVPFAFFGTKKIDPSAAEGTWGFKLLIIPGSAIFWPCLLGEVVEEKPAAGGAVGASGGSKGLNMQRSHRIRHRVMWLVLAPLALAAFVYALMHRVEMPVMEEVPGSGGEERAE